MIILLIFALLILGLVNTMLSSFIWRSMAPTQWKSLIGHGGLMLVLLGIFGIPALILDYYVPATDVALLVAVTIPRVIIYAIIYGYTGKFVSYGFSTIPAAPEVSVAPAGLLATCPECFVETLCTVREDSTSKVITCTNCGKPYEVFKPE
jgi:hypothetical protein